MAAEAIFKKYDFVKLTEEDNEKLHDDLRRLENIASEEIDVQDMKNAIKVFQDKICVPHFPARHSEPSFACGGAIHAIFRAVSDVCEHHNIEQTEFQECFYQFFVACIRAGPGTAHTEFASTIFGERDYDIQEYVNNIPGMKDIFGKHCFSTLELQRGRARSFIKELQKHFHSEEPEREELSTYLTLMHSFIGRYCLDLCLEPHCNNPKLTEDIIELLFFNLGQLTTDVHEDQRTYYGYDITCICSHFEDKNPFKTIKDGALLCKYMEQVRDLFLSKKFAGDEPSTGELVDVFKLILATSKETGNLASCAAITMDILSDINEKGPSPLKNKFVDAIGTFYYHMKEKDVKNNTKLFDIIAPKFAKLLENMKEPELFERLARGIVLDTLKHCTGTTPAYGEPWVKIIIGLVLQSHPEFMYCAIEPLRFNQKIFKWKDNPKWAKDIFDACSKVVFPEVTEENERFVDKLIGYCEDFMEYFLGPLKPAKLLPQLMDEMVTLCLSYMECGNAEICKVSKKIAQDYLDLKKHPNSRLQILRKLDELLKKEDYSWEDIYVKVTATELLERILDSYKDGNDIPKEENTLLLSILKLSMSKSDEFYEGYPVEMSVHCRIFVSCCFVFLNKHSTSKSLECFEVLMPGLMEIKDNVMDHEDISTIFKSMIYTISTSASEILAKYIDQMIDVFLENPGYELITAIANAYPFNPKDVAKKFDGIFQYMTEDDMSIAMGVAMLMDKVSKKQPELFTEEKIAKTLEISENQQIRYYCLTIIKNLSESHPDKVKKLLKKLVTVAEKEETFFHNFHEILVNIAMKFKDVSKTVIDFLIKKIQSTQNITVIQVSLGGLRVLTGKYLEDVKKHQPYIEKLKASNSDVHVKDGCTSLIDLFEGRSLEGISSEVNQQRDDIDELETRVDNTENEIEQISSEVDSQKKDISNLEDDVKETGERVDKVEEHVEELDVKVEEIDHKTMSNAPKWSRDVTKLMNPKDEYDWRLLAKRLGYNNEDIKAWSTQSDPCMAVLSEIYGTHKTREANNAVLTALQEMNRTDAAAIVENAMKSAEDVVEDEEFEYAVPPEVFLSYQWGIQDHVKLLKKHLEMAGYTCWMDIGQMGGGDKLFEKIDKGIRGAKAIICCVTDKYAKSPNCNREVNLSVNLGKSMIPLLMEKSTWPPEGSMGPIFSEYLFIRFFQRGAEETDDERYWPVPKFQELLMQLNCYKILPDESTVDPFYKNWWQPVAEEIVIKKKKDGTKSSGGSSSGPSSDEKSKEESPEVFISYQWGKQKQIICLYKRLTEMGFNCWMDIHQMGGGDSLYDKIDRGVRGCRVVVSSCTEKYALSANCRREVSLADALKKPIIPMLLEKIDWPPRGPMSMVFTEMLFINFYRDPDVQTNWTGPKFDELVQKIREHVPDENADAAASVKGEDKADTKEEKTTESVSKKDVTVSEKDQTEKKSETSIDVVSKQVVTASGSDRPEKNAGNGVKSKTSKTNQGKGDSGRVGNNNAAKPKQIPPANARTRRGSSDKPVGIAKPKEVRKTNKLAAAKSDKPGSDDLTKKKGAEEKKEESTTDEAAANNSEDADEKKAVLKRLNVKMAGEAERQARNEWKKVNNVRIATKSKSCDLL